MKKLDKWNFIALISLLAGLILRLWLHETDFWLDELNTIHRSSQDLKDFSLFQETFHPPLFYILEKIFILIFRYEEWAFKLPANIAGFALAIMVFKFQTKHPGSRTALFGMLMQLCPAFLYYHSQARAYGLIALIGFMIFWLYYESQLQNPSRRKVVTLFILASLMSYTTFFLLIPLCFYKLAHQKKTILLMTAIILGFGGMFLVNVYVPSDTFVHLKWIDEMITPVKFIESQFMRHILVNPILGIFLMWRSFQHRNSKESFDQLCWWVTSGSIAMLLAFSVIVKNVFYLRYLIIVYPFLFYLLTLGTVQITKWLQANIAVNFILILLLWNSFFGNRTEYFRTGHDLVMEELKSNEEVAIIDEWCKYWRALFRFKKRTITRRIQCFSETTLTDVKGQRYSPALNGPILIPEWDDWPGDRKNWFIEEVAKDKKLEANGNYGIFR